jgi:hypothetical protein
VVTALLPAVVIEWQAPSACPDAASVRAATERLLGKSLDSVRGTTVRARGGVTPSEAGKWALRAELEVAGHVETDTLVANKCSALRDAMALKVALAIDPLAVVETVQPPASPSEPEQLRAPGPQPAPGRLRIGLRVVGQVGLGPLPGTTPGAGIYGSLQSSWFRIELGAQAFWAGVARYESPPEVGADLHLFAAALRGCVVPGAGQWFFPICAGSELGVMRGRGFGVEETAVSSGLWGGVVFGPAAQWCMTRRVSLWVEADAVLSVLTPEFHMRNLSTLYAPPSAGARAAAGFEANF